MQPAAKWPIWCCPDHQQPLREQGDLLVCTAGEYYPRRNGIPRFVRGGKYAAAFGLQWNKYRLTQLDSYTGTTISEQRARRCIGDELWNTLAGKQVLECGCGAGRFTEVLLGRNVYLTSIDLSEAVDANQENFPRGAHHRIAQADIEHLPFERKQFDMVFCLGVIQHTPNPEKTIAYLYDQVRPGGCLVIDHYAPRLSWYTKTAPLFRLYLRRMSPDRGIRLTEKLVNTLLPLHKMTRRFRPAQAVLNRLSPVLCYYHAYPDLDDRIQQEWAFLDTHDSLTDYYRHVRTQQQIRRTLEQLGLTDVWCVSGGNGIEARGRRPLP